MQSLAETQHVLCMGVEKHGIRALEAIGHPVCLHWPFGIALEFHWSGYGGTIVMPSLPWSFIQEPCGESFAWSNKGKELIVSVAIEKGIHKNRLQWIWLKMALCMFALLLTLLNRVFPLCLLLEALNHHREEEGTNPIGLTYLLNKVAQLKPVATKIESRK